MSNEEFQKLVLEQLKELKAGQKDIKTQVSENTQILKALEHSAEVNKAEHDRMSMDIAKLSGKIEGLRSDLSTVEVIAAKNNLDIAQLKAVK